MQNANTLEAMEVARQLILVLKGTVESLQMNLSQERDDNEGLKLTIESLEDENARLQEELFKVQAGAVEEKDTAKENQAEAIEAIGEKLAFYYKDMKRIDPKKLTAEDGEILYNILDYNLQSIEEGRRENGEIRKHGFNQRFHKYKRHCESCSAAFLMEWVNPEV